MRTYAPEAAALRETLEKLLASETFARSERARKLLRYLVEQEQAGQAGRLKGFAIAVDVFGRDSEFDSSTDALVRVQAGRLRDLLDQYFANEGAGDPIRIAIPRGSYVPAYARAGEAAATVKPAAPGLGLVKQEPEAATPAATKIAVPRQRQRPVASYFMRQVRLFWVAFAVVIGMLGFVAYNSYMDGMAPQMTSAANAAPANRLADAIVSLPKAYLRASDTEDSRKVASIMRSALSSFDTVVFINREVPPAGDAPPLDFVFDITPGPEDSSVEVTLQNIRSGQVITSRVFSPADLHPLQLEDQIADLATATLPVSGALYAFLESSSLQRGLTECLLLNDDYYLDQTAEKHKLAYQCFERMRDAGAHSPLIYSEMAALHLETVSDGYDYPPDASQDIAVELARKAVQMAPTSPYAHRSYGFIYASLKNHVEAIRWMKKAYELGHFDLSMAAAYGYALVMAGKYVEGSPVMLRAVNASSARPTWWDYGLFLGQYMLDNAEAAADATDALSTSKRPHYIAARLLAAKLRRDEVEAERLLTNLVQNHKKFAEDPRSMFVGAGYPTDMIEKLVIGLAAAGLLNDS